MAAPQRGKGEGTKAAAVLLAKDRVKGAAFEGVETLRNARVMAAEKESE